MRFILSYVGDADDVGKYTGCCYACACAISFDNHRILAITLGRNKYYVVAVFKLVQRMLAIDCLQSYLGNTVVEACHITQMLPSSAYFCRIFSNSASISLICCINVSMSPSKYSVGMKWLTVTSSCSMA